METKLLKNQQQLINTKDNLTKATSMENSMHIRKHTTRARTSLDILGELCALHIFVLSAVTLFLLAFLGNSNEAQAQTQQLLTVDRQTAQTKQRTTVAPPTVITTDNLPTVALSTKSATIRTENGGDTKDEAEESRRTRELMLLERVEQLERRLAEVEARGGTNSSVTTLPATIATATPTTPDSQNNSNPQNQNQVPDNTGRVGAADPRQVSDDDHGVLDFFKRTTVNLTVDGYYGYNFNRPVGGINLLRAYDVQSNSFSLNQAGLIVERAPDVEAGQRFGLRLDLQYGQATESAQANPGAEPRPQVYRNVWQAYGTYVAPLGNGVTIDFGKFAGALGYETNYSKDNFNYSRAFFFNFFPFYHSGFRTTYSPNDKVTLQNWIVNGANQTEDFNGFKSTAFLVTYKPTARVTSQFNYYNGQEQRDRNPALNPGFAPVASQSGLSIDVIRPVPGGRFHVLDAYATFNVTDNLTLALEGDYAINRVSRDSAPARVVGGAGYARYQFTPKFAGAARFEYLSDRGGLFSGVTQALKEGTLTAEYKFADGFLGRAEYRRDYSNQPYFLTEVPGILKKEQNTGTIGLVFWIGRKQGTW